MEMPISQVINDIMEVEKTIVGQGEPSEAKGHLPWAPLRDTA